MFDRVLTTPLKGKLMLIHLVILVRQQLFEIEEKFMKMRSRNFFSIENAANLIKPFLESIYKDLIKIFY